MKVVKMSPKKSKNDESLIKKKKKLKTSPMKSIKVEYPSDPETDLETELLPPDIELPVSDTEQHQPDIEAQLYSNKSPILWPSKDTQELIKRIELAIPPKDTISYKSRVEKLNWDDIAFGDYTGDECKRTWNKIQTRVRRFRVLRELIEDAKEWNTRPWTSFYGGVKTNRHPDMPKRPLTTYMLFYLSTKDRVIKANPGIEMTDLSRRIAEMYKTEPQAAKDKYNLLAAEHRREYEEKMEEFHRLHPEMLRVAEKGGKVHASGALQAAVYGLKKPSTPFKIFSEDRIKRLKDDPDFERNVVLEQCKEQWKIMSDKKKVFWIDWALEEEGRYVEKLKMHMSENPDFVPPPMKPVLTKEEKSIKERMAGKPSKPPNSAYSLFSRMMLKDDRLKNVNPKERMQVISTEWKKITETDKKEYQERVKHLLEQYKLDFATYLESLPDEKKAEELLNNQPKRKRVAAPAPKKALKSNPKEGGKKKARKEKSIAKASAVVFEGEPEPLPQNAYMLFAQSYAKNDPKKLKKAEIKWNEMSNLEKLSYRKDLHKMKQDYITNYEKFLKSLAPDQLQEYSRISQFNQKEKEDNDTAAARESESEYSSSSSDDEADDSSSDSDSSSNVSVY